MGGDLLGILMMKSLRVSIASLLWQTLESCANASYQIFRGNSQFWKRVILSLGLRLHDKETREGQNISSIEAKAGNTGSSLKEGLVYALGMNLSLKSL